MLWFNSRYSQNSSGFVRGCWTSFRSVQQSHRKLNGHVSLRNRPSEDLTTAHLIIWSQRPFMLGFTQANLSKPKRWQISKWLKYIFFFFPLSTSEAVKGWHSSHPGRSCKDILESEDSVGDGEYWIDPEGNGKSLKVYCDMTTGGGKLPSAALLFSKS